MSTTGTTTIKDKPLFAITPAASLTSVAVESPNSGKPSDVAIGMPSSDSTARLMPTPTDDIASQDSRESLLVGGRKESWLTIFSQVFIPFIIAGLGMVGAGVILDVVKDWDAFTQIPEFLILVTPLLGLKGNLEMTLASRLSTHANLGHMDVSTNQKSICMGNMCLVQVQGVVVGFLSSMVAIFIGVILPGTKPFNFVNAIVLSTSSIATAGIASFALGGLMIFVILTSRKFNVNPDNIATPIAGTVGDVTTLGLLAAIASNLNSAAGRTYACPIILTCYLILTPILVWMTYKNDFTQKVLISGWTPVISAMLISSGGGLILDKAEQKFAALALYQPVINGVGGNLVSVQASRISTSLHRDSNPGQLPDGITTFWMTPWEVFGKKGVDSVAARVLLGLVVPGHLIFAAVTYMISSDSQNSLAFLLLYLMAAIIQVGFLLYLAQVLIRWLWLRKIDPDTSSIPYLTALGDLIGTALLFVAFEGADFFSKISS